MGCSTSDRTKEETRETNKGYPVCRLSVSITGEIDSMVSYDSNRIILGGKNELQLFDSKTKEISLLSNEHRGRINCLIKLPDGKIVSGGQDSKIKIWDINKKECISTLEGHTSIIWDIKYLKKNMLISAADDNTSKIWDIQNKSSINLYSSKRHISCVAVLKNNKVLLAAGKNLLLFDLNTKDQESCLDLSVWTITTLKNGDVAAGLGNGLLYILQITDEIIVKTEFPRGHNSTINSIIELSDGKIVTISDENEPIMWDRDEPLSIYMIKGHTDKVLSICLIEGNKFASFSKDNTLKIWD